MLGDIKRQIRARKPSIHLCKPDMTAIAKINDAQKLNNKTRLADINELEFRVPYHVDIKHELKKTPYIDNLRNRYLLRMDLGAEREYYIIRHVGEDSDSNGDYKSVKASSLGYELRDKFIRNYKVTSYNAKEAMTDALSQTIWTLGSNISDLDHAFNQKYRSFDVSKKSILEFVQEIAKTFNAIIIWDTVNRVIDFEIPENIGDNKGLTFSYSKYLQSFSKELDSNEMVTRLTPIGKGNLTIHGVNPTGTGYIEDFSFFMYPFKRDAFGDTIQSSYYMSDELCHAILDYQELVESKEDEYANLLDNKTTYQQELSTLNNDLFDIETEQFQVQNRIDTQKSTGEYKIHEYSFTDSETGTFNSSVEYKYAIIASGDSGFTLSSEGNSVVSSSGETVFLRKIGSASSTDYNISNSVNGTNIDVELVEITEDEYDEAGNESDILDAYSLVLKQSQVDAQQALVDYKKEEIDSVDSSISSLQGELAIENNFSTKLINERNQYIINKEWNNSNYTSAEDLISGAKEHFEKIRKPKLVIKIDIINFLEVIEEQKSWDKLVKGDFVKIKHEILDEIISAKIVDIDYDYGNGTISLEIANVEDIKSDEDEFVDKLYGAISTSSTVDMNIDKWAKIDEANAKVDGILNEPWDVTKRAIVAGTNEDVSWGKNGLIIKNPNDPNKYLVANHGVLAITNSGGKKWEHAITTDGIIGEQVIGKLLAGQNLLIENESGTFTVDGNGVTIRGTALQLLSETDENLVDYWNSVEGSAQSYANGIRDNLNSEISDLNTEISSTNNYIDNSFKDGVIEESEKLAIKEHLKQLEAQQNDVVKRYQTVYGNSSLDGVEKTDVYNAKQDFDSKYTALVNAINTAIADSAIIEDERFSVETAFSNYSSSLGTLSDKLEFAIDKITENKKQDAIGHADNLKVTIDSNISDLNDTLTNTNNYIDNSFHDGVIEEAEAKAIEKHIDQLDARYDSLENRKDEVYTNADIGSTEKSDLATKWSSFANDGHTPLKNSINSAISNGKTTTAEKTTVDNAFGTYRTKLADLERSLEVAVNSIASKKASDAQANAEGYADDMKDLLDIDISDINDRVDSLDLYVDNSFRDGVITEAEAISIRKHINALNTEKEDIDNRYTKIYNSSFLRTSSVKTSLFDAKNDYDTKHSSLIASINSAINDDNATQAEINDVDTKFTAYKASIGVLSGALEDSVDDIAKSKANDAQSNAEGYADGLKTAIDQDVADVNDRVDSMDDFVKNSFRDGIITESEAISIKKQINTLGAEKTDIDNRYAKIYNSSFLRTSSVKTSLFNAKSDYDSKHNNLISSINTAISDDKASQTEIDDVNSKFSLYETSLGSLSGAFEDAIDDISKSKSDDAQSNAETYADGLKTAIDQDIADVDDRVGDLDLYIDNSFRDGVISEAEAIAIEKHINSLDSEKSDLDNRYSKIYGSSYLRTSSVKSALSSAKSDYDSKHSSLISSINTAIIDGTATQTEINDVNSKFSLYETSIGSLSSALEDAIDDIAKSKADDAKNDAITYASKGQLYARGTGYNRSGNRVLRVNDSDVYNSTGRGLRLTTIERSDLSVSFDQTYDVYLDDTDKNSLATKLNALDDSVIVVLTSEDAIATNQTLEDAIERVGGTGTTFGGAFHRVPYALVGIPNIGKGAGLEMFTDMDTDSPMAEISTKIIDGIPQGIDVTRRALWLDAKSDAKDAQDDADTANSLLSDIASDSKITPSEKHVTKKEWDVIVSEKSSLEAQASTFGLSSSGYTNAYNSLSTYITPILSNLSTTSTINGGTFRSKFKSYYDERTNLLNSVSDKAKTLADNAQNTASNAWGKFSGSGNTLPKGNVDFNFADSNSQGGNAKNTDKVGTQDAVNVQNSTVNFNSRNDRISTTPRNPVISGNGSAVDHSLNTDGSVDISFEWTFDDSGNAGNIDGFLVYVYSTKSTSASYSFGTSVNSESVYYVTPEKTAMVFKGVPADKYYTFGIQSYRIVDKDINSNEVIMSSLIKPSVSAENPYRPSSSVAFNGDVKGTIDGTSASTVKGNAVNSLQKDTAYNNVKLSQSSGFTATRSDNKYRTIMNATDGMKIQSHNGTSWQDKFFADTNGVLNAQGLVIKDQSGSSIMIDADAKKIDFTQFDILAGKLNADNITIGSGTSFETGYNPSTNLKEAKDFFSKNNWIYEGSWSFPNEVGHDFSFSSIPEKFKDNMVIKLDQHDLENGINIEFNGTKIVDAIGGTNNTREWKEFSIPANVINTSSDNNVRIYNDVDDIDAGTLFIIKLEFDTESYARELKDDLQMTSPLPTSLSFDSNGITASASGGYARLDYRGLYVNGGAIQIDGGLSASQLDESVNNGLDAGNSAKGTLDSLPSGVVIDGNGITANKTGGGYARLDNNGLLISGGAIQIVGGLKKSEIDSSVTSSWDSKADGTYVDGDGIYTGNLIADQIKGGTLELGGTIGNVGQDGRFVVYDANEDPVVEIDASAKGFKELVVGDVLSESVMKVNNKDVTIYVDSDQGDDNEVKRNWDDPAWVRSFKTIQGAIDSIPKNNNGKVKIWVDWGFNGYGQTKISGFYGSGEIKIEGKSDTSTLEGVLSIESNIQRVIEWRNIHIKDDGNTTGGNSVSTVYLRSSLHVEIFDTKVNSNGEKPYSMFQLSGTGFARNSVFSNADTACVHAGSAANIRLDDCTGSSDYGASVSGSTIYITGNSMPSGSVSATRVLDAGTINGGATESSSGTETVEAVTKTKRWISTSGESYRENGWGWQSYNDVRQGEWNGYGRNIGLWFFGSSPSDTVAGKTVKKVRIKVKRLSGAGHSGDVTAKFRWHTHTSQPAGAPDFPTSEEGTAKFRWDDDQWVTLPSSFYNNWESGTCKGIAIHTTSRSNSDYMKFDDRAELEIQYE